MNRLIAQNCEDGPESRTLQFGYDINDNIISRGEDGTKKIYAYSTIGQLQGDGITYDALGRMTNDGLGLTITYDSLDRVTSTNLSGAKPVTYTYGPDGFLATRADAATGLIIRFYQLGGQVVSQKTMTSPHISTWTHFSLSNGKYIAEEQGDKSRLIIPVMGSSMASVVNGKVDLHKYDPYGKPVEKNSASFGWKQEYCDPGNGLVYLRARYYHPVLMSFISRDTWLTANRYGFSAGNPIDLSDPSGHLPGFWDSVCGFFCPCFGNRQGQVHPDGNGNINELNCAENVEQMVNPNAPEADELNDSVNNAILRTESYMEVDVPRNEPLDLDPFQWPPAQPLEPAPVGPDDPLPYQPNVPLEDPNDDFDQYFEDGNGGNQAVNEGAQEEDLNDNQGEQGENVDAELPEQSGPADAGGDAVAEGGGEVAAEGGGEVAAEGGVGVIEDIAADAIIALIFVPK